uniref:hypothetical protein n=1 Tax=Methylobacterium sp. B34 TaxID=95563 RepID=UPI000346E8B6|nr:hypothetical protein [Methylobacterium sp. B34]
MTEVLPADALAKRGLLDRAQAARSVVAARPRVLFVSHTGTMSGAELVLRDAVRPWAGSSAFLFEDGALTAALRDAGSGDPSRASPVRPGGPPAGPCHR